MTPTRDYLVALLRDAGRVELRHQAQKRWTTSWHTDPDDLLATARQNAFAGNLFTSLNHVCTCSDAPIGNDDIDRFVRLFVDLDPARPTGAASTDKELAAARSRAVDLRRHLVGHGWPPPSVAMSGNGYHLQFRTALPNTSATREQLAAIYTGLNRRFGDDVVSFDRSVRNPGRICTLYGSVKRKGVATAERPHRKSHIVIPREWRQVHPRTVETLANIYTKENHSKRAQRPQARAGETFAHGAGDYGSLDVVAWFQAHGAYVRHITGNVHGVRCPWSQEHNSPSPADAGDTVIFEADGSWPGFHCKHMHCSDRTIRDAITLWSDADQFCRRAYNREVHHV